MKPTAVTDNCDAHPIVSYTDVSTTVGCVTTIKRNWRVTDACGNVSWLADSVQTITIKDTTAPTFTRPADTLIAQNSSCNSNADTNGVARMKPTAVTDNCDDNPTVSYTDVSTTVGCVTTIKRNWRVTDACGNVSWLADSVQTITIKDTTAPTFTRPADTLIAQNSSCNSNADTNGVPRMKPTAVTDNCDAHPTVSYTDVSTTVGCVTTIKRNWRVTDACGNVSWLADSVQTITIKDTTAPTFTRPADTLIAQNSSCNSNADTNGVPKMKPTAVTDNCDDNPTVSFTDVSTTVGCVTTIKRNWRVTDACGNVSWLADSVQTITIKDTIRPTYTRPADTMIARAANCSFSTDTTDRDKMKPSALSDNCSGALTVTFRDSDTTTICANSFSFKRTWRVVDACGNVSLSDSVQTITIQDTTRPTIGTIELPAIVNEDNCQYSIPSLETKTIEASNDNCSSPVIWVGQTASPAPDDGDKYNQTDADRIITVTVTVKDDCGNQTSKDVTYTIPKNDLTLTVAVEDTICFGATAHLRATAESSNTPLTYSWTPAEGVTEADEAEATVAPATAGNHTFRMTVTDNNGCSIYKDTTVNVREKMTLTVNTGSHTEYCKNETIVDNIGVTPDGGSGRYTYAWTVNDGSTTTDAGTTASITPSTSTVGTFTYSVTVHDAAGCGDSTREVVTITIHPLPELNVVPQEQSKCTGGEISPIGITPANATITIENVTLTHEGGTATASDLATLGLTANPAVNPTSISGAVHGSLNDTIRFHVIATSLYGCGTVDSMVTIVIADTTRQDYYVDTCVHYLWPHNGVGGTDYTSAGVYRFYEDGNHTDVSGCDSVTYLHLTLHDDPVPTVADDTVCLGSTATLTVTDGNGVLSGYDAYLWNSTATTQSIDTVPTTIGDHDFSVTVTQIYSATAHCQATTTAHVTVQDTVKLTIENDTQTVCLGQAITPIPIIYDSASITLAPSSLADGLAMTTPDRRDTITGTPTPAGVYEYEVTATSSYARHACTPKQHTIQITVNDTLVPGLPDAVNVCASSSLDTNSVTLTSAGLTADYSHTWTATGSTTESVTGQNRVTLSYSTPGEYTVVLVAENLTSGCVSRDTTHVHVDTVPTPTVSGEQIICRDASTELTTEQDASYSYLWSDGVTVTYNAVVDETGDYHVKVTDGNGCSAQSADFHVTELEALTLSEGSRDTVYCLNAVADSLSLTAHGGDGTYTYTWEFQKDGGAWTACGTNDSVYTPLTSESGTYVYRVTVTDGHHCGDSVRTIATVTVREKLTVVNAQVSTAYCSGTTASEIGVTVTGGSGEYTYQWTVSTDSVTFTPIATDSAYTPSTAVADTFYYNIIVSDAVAACGDTTLHVQKVIVHPLPELNVVPQEQSKCTGGSIAPIIVTPNYATVTIEDVTLTHEGGTPTTIDWSDLNLTAEPAVNPTLISGPVSGSLNDTIRFHVIATSLYGCGTVDSMVTIVIADTTRQDYYVDTCVHYLWPHNGVGGTDYTSAGVYRFYEDGNHTDVSGCDSVTYLHLTLHDDPVPTVADDTVCLGSTATLTVTDGNGVLSGYDAYLWNSTATTQSIDTVPTTIGDHDFSVTVTQIYSATAHCQATTTAHVTVQDTVKLTIENDTQTVCLGQAITPIPIIYDSASITLAPSSLADGLAMTTPDRRDTITGTPTPAGVYEYEVTATSSYARHACTPKQHTIQITVNDTLVPGLPDAVNVCASSSLDTNSVTLTSAGLTADYSHTWTATGSTTESVTGQNRVTLSYSTPGEYTVVLVAENLTSGCVSRDTTHVHVDTVPTPTVSGEQIICRDASTELTTEQDASYSYLWSDGVTVTYNAVVDETGDYHVKVTDGNGCSAQSADFHVTELEALTLSEGSRDTVYCLNAVADSLSLTAHGGDGTYTYTWEFQKDGGAWTACGTNDSVYTPLTSESGTYVYRVTVTDGHHCGDSVRTIATVTVREKLTVVNAQVSTAYCSGTTASEIGVTVTGGSGEYTYQWTVSTDSVTFTPIATDSAYTPSTAVADTFYYNITVSDAVAACGDTTLHVQKVIVHPLPELTIADAQRVQSVCAGGRMTTIKPEYSNANQELEFYTALPSELTYTVSDSTITASAIHGTIGQVYTFTVIAVSPFGCKNDSVECTITVGDTNIVHLPIEACVRYHWDHDGGIDYTSADNGTHRFYYPDVKDQNGCDSVTYLHLTVYDTIEPIFSVLRDVCTSASLANDSIEVSVQDYDGYSYVWTIDGATRAASSPTAVDGVSDTNVVVLRWSDEGDKYLTVTMTNLTTNCVSVGRDTIHVHKTPAVEIEPVASDICPYSGMQSVTANVTTTTTADYIYTWSGELAMTPAITTTDAASNEVAATIPTLSCDTTYKVGVNVVDTHGCKANADSVTLTVRDVEVPTFTRPNDTTLYKNATCEYDIAVATLNPPTNLDDNCTAVADLVVSHSDDTVAGSCYGETIVRRTWTVTDQCGRVSAEQVQTITIQDTTRPAISGTLSDTTVTGCGEDDKPLAVNSLEYLREHGLTVGDNCSDDAHMTVTSSDAEITGTCDKTIIRTYTVTDDCGNANSATQTVTILYPELVVPTIDTMQRNCEVDANEPTPEVLNLCGTYYTAVKYPNDADYRESTVGEDGIGFVTYNYRYTTCKGTYDWHLTYHVSPTAFDSIAPKDSTVACPIAVLSQIEMEELKPTVTMCGEDVTVYFDSVRGNITQSCGDSTYYYHYTVNDTLYHWSFTFHVVPNDFEMPADSVKVVSCPADVKVPHENGMMPVVTDACGFRLDSLFVNADEVPTCQDSVIYTYRYTDCAGHEHPWHFRYSIERSGAPVVATGFDDHETVECLANAVALDPTDATRVPHATSSCLDDLAGALLGSDTVWNDADARCEGTVAFTYQYEDCIGETATWTYTYTIERHGAVTINTEDVANKDTVECPSMAMPTFAIPTAESSCHEPITGVLTDSTYTEDAGSCNATKTYTYTYTDCSGNNFDTWTFEYRIELPETIAEVPATGTAERFCAIDAAQPGAATIHDVCGREIVPVYYDSTAAMAADGTGTVTHRYRYTDCEGHDSIWSFVYTITPDAFIEEPNDTVTIHCITEIVEPSFDGTPRIPVFNVCGAEYSPVLTATENTVNTGGCGDSTFTYSYTINAVTHTWSYTYHVTPEPFTLPDDDSISVECISAVSEPTPPTVENNCHTNIAGILDHIDTNWTVDGCEGTIAFVYRYEDCTEFEDFWTYTYRIDRVTPPSERGTAVATASTVSCMEEAVLPATMPEVRDVCDNMLEPADTAITESNNNCNGSRTYSFTYRDCSGLEMQWAYVYTVKDTIRPEIGEIGQQTALAAGNCQFKMPDLTATTLAVSSDNCGHDVTFVSQTPDTNARFNQLLHEAQTIEVTVTVADECGNDTTRTVQVYIPASEVHVTASNDVAICLGNSTTLTADGGSDNLGGTVTYEWTPANGLDRTDGNSVVATPDDTTTYTVTVTDENGCQESDEVTVIIYPLVELTANDLDQTVCAGADITPINIGFANATVGISGLPSAVQYSLIGAGNGQIAGHPHMGGNFTITATSLYGCPTEQLHGSITVSDTLHTELSETACDTYNWPTDGATYNTTGRYRWHTMTTAGCDSVVYLNLTVNYQSFGIDDVTECDSYTWTRGDGETYTASTNTPTHVFPNGNAVGCDSTVTLHLTIHYSNSGEETVLACDSYTWYGVTYTEDAEPTQMLQNIWGCDSLATLHLTVRPSYHFNDVDSLCEGDTYTYHGQTYAAGGDFDVNFQSVFGCDSVYSLHLVFLPTLAVEIEKDVNCIYGWYELTAVATPETHSEVFNYNWYSKTQFGPSVDEGHNATLMATPHETTNYHVTVGYGANMRCPQTGHITVDPFIIPHASITTRPGHLNDDVTTWYADYSTFNDFGSVVREWYIDGEYYSQQTQHISGEYDLGSGNDSVIVELIARSEQCADTAHAAIPYIKETIYVPNVFTPSTEINNLFGPVGCGILDLEMWVYTREGLLVFHSTSMEEKWDGKHQGTNTDCPTATYTYRIDYTMKGTSEALQTKVGTVTLIR